MSILAKDAVRLYHMEDEEQEVRGQTMHDNLALDLADFTARFPWLDPLFVAAFLGEVNAAKNFPDDGAILSNQKVLTENVNAAVALGLRALDTIDIYAQLAYRNEKAKQRVFGQDTWQVARSDQEKMIDALKHCHSFANKTPYKTDLMGKGLTQIDIDVLLTIATDIEGKNALQEQAISERPVTTQDRINIHNTLWERMKTVAICALLVYRDDAAKLAQYRLYPPGTTVATQVIINVVEPGTNNPRVNAEVALVNTQLGSEFTDANGNAGFQSVNMPDFVDVKAIFNGNIATLNGQPILQGDEVTIKIEV